MAGIILSGGLPAPLDGPDAARSVRTVRTVHVSRLQRETEACPLLVKATVVVIQCKCPESSQQHRGNPIYLGIRDPDLCLFCEEVEGWPRLRLKVSDGEK